jgi:hypothetical protein
MKEVTITLNEYILEGVASGKRMRLQSVLTLAELYSLIAENEKEQASYKVESSLSKLYGEDEG